MAISYCDVCVCVSPSFMSSYSLRIVARADDSLSALFETGFIIFSNGELPTPSQGDTRNYT